MKKRLISVMLIISTIFTFAACKKSNELTTKESIVKMEVGGTHKVELDKDIENVTWESRDNDIATVSPEGVITAVGGGITVVSARTENSYVHIGVDVKGNKEYVDKDGNIIEVFDGASDITEIEVGVKTSSARGDITVKVGDSVTLRTYTTPSDSKDKIVWRTADASIASVNEKGEMRAIGKGKTEITAYAPNGVKGKLIVRVK